MTTEKKVPAYYEGCNPALLGAVSSEARRILDVGCGAGRLGAALKHERPDRVVMGIEREPEVASVAAAALDKVFALDISSQTLPDDDAGFDCILFGDVLEHLVDPLAVLDRLVCRLAPGGCILCYIPNAQHHTMLEALLTGDFQYQPSGLLDSTHLRFFTLSTAMKLLLDAGLEPDLADTIRVPSPPGLLQAALPLLNRLGLDARGLAARLEAYQYILRGRPMSTAPVSQEPFEPVTIVTCVTDPAQLNANLLASPDLGPGSPHEVLLDHSCRSAAEAINRALDGSRHRLCIFAHQDVYLPRGWIGRFLTQMEEAGRRLGRMGVCGVYGVANRGGSFVRAGRVVDRERLLAEPEPLPCVVDTLDELLLAIPRPSPLRVNPDLGFHLYGADLGLQAREHGLAAAVIDAPCLHNSRSVGVPPEFARSVEVFQRVWADALPVGTSCARIERNGVSRL
jgi:SAM-dependent methyltransferase